MFSMLSSKKKLTSKTRPLTHGRRKTYNRRILIESLESRNLLAAVPILNYAFPVGGSEVEPMT
jgi:hypothetical protein